MWRPGLGLIGVVWRGWGVLIGPTGGHKVMAPGRRVEAGLDEKYGRYIQSSQRVTQRDRPGNRDADLEDW